MELNLIEDNKIQEGVYNMDYEPYTIITPLVNRSMKRTYVKELSKIIMELEQINHMFLTQLFDPELTHISYKELYDWYSGQWQQMCQHFHSVVKPKTIVVNPRYFSELYKPIEKF
jgi:hypothetical protein